MKRPCFTLRTKNGLYWLTKSGGLYITMRSQTPLSSNRFDYLQRAASIKWECKNILALWNDHCFVWNGYCFLWLKHICKASHYEMGRCSWAKWKPKGKDKHLLCTSCLPFHYKIIPPLSNFIHYLDNPLCLIPCSICKAFYRENRCYRMHNQGYFLYSM